MSDRPQEQIDERSVEGAKGSEVTKRPKGSSLEKFKAKIAKQTAAKNKKDA